MIASLPGQCRLVEQPGLGQQELQLYTSKHQFLSLLDWENWVNPLQGAYLVYLSSFRRVADVPGKLQMQQSFTQLVLLKLHIQQGETMSCDVGSKATVVCPQHWCLRLKCSMTQVKTVMCCNWTCEISALHALEANAFNQALNSTYSAVRFAFTSGYTGTPYLKLVCHCKCGLCPSICMQLISVT